MIMLGYFLYHWSGGSWLREFSGFSSNGRTERVLIATGVASFGLMGSIMVLRTDKEDAMLRKEFSEWEQWAGKVPWKLIPFIY